jgi:alginate O-acetyltransferase complex protein AlgJ
VQKIIKYILPIAFLMLLVLPLANSKFEFFKSERKDENRSFSDSLSFDVKRLDRFPKLAEAYMNDNFSFRTPLLDLFHHIKFYHFNISPHPTKTVVGNDGWFFMAKDEKEIYEGDHNFSENELDDFLSEWQRRRKYLDSSGIKSYWVIAPFKHYVYQEKLPFNIVKSKKRRVDQLKDHFKNDLSDLIIDPLPVFLKHKSENRLFAKMDNHWNYQAGYLTTKILLDKLRKDFPNSNIEDVPLFTWKNDVINSGYHHQVIGVA